MMIMITDLDDIDDMDDVDNVADVDDVADVDVSWCFMKNLVDYDGPCFSLCSNSQRNPKHLDHQLVRLTSSGGMSTLHQRSSYPSPPEILPSDIVAQEESRWKSQWTGGRAQFSQIEAIISSRLRNVSRAPFLVSNLQTLSFIWGPMAWLWYEKLNPICKTQCIGPTTS